MPDSTLPEQIKPLKLAKKGTSLNGVVSLEKLPAIKLRSLEADGLVRVDLDFDMRDNRYPSVTGLAQINLGMQCQRCLEPVVSELRAEISLDFVPDEEAAERLPEAYEPFILGDEEISLYELIEQELILRLPIVAYHDQCDAYDYRKASGFSEPEQIAVEEGTDNLDENPFGVLAQLKGKLKSSDD